ncbi:hypothetical protein ACUNWD_01975 [Sunxiuqinia sp. A32]|uniref:hypothetical protein n=1 Tax=Sunxiuqinia sp. A32 TaxID=3461496 RepID=UPI004045C5B6
MKKISGIIGVVMAVLMFSSVYAQNSTGSRNRCLTQISDLSDTQKEQIVTLSSDHQAKMTELRNERRSTTDVSTKNELREKMNIAKATHQSNVLNLLNKGQQVQYLALTSTGQGKFQRGDGKGNSKSGVKGKGQGRGKGSGNCQGNKGNNQGGKGKNRSNTNI